MAFTYKTRGNSSPNEKPRVCFLSHPDDFEAYFDKISSEILELNNCVIWYGEGGREELTDLTELTQMQLVVFPVTRKLLLEENALIKEYLPYVLEQKIPILPIMEESGLDALFAEKCGDLEYLDRNAIDDKTALPYGERLKRFLESILLDDGRIDQIRAAFDAYIFLSYRKKDRAYAQSLMSLIHENDFCEKVAIWYDEFLVPGESFNQAIEDALKKSNLFSMVVTPNLVNEKNYVMDVEYPMAKKNNKAILPFEMVQTEVGELKKSYSDIPDPIKPAEAEFEQRLKDYLPVASASNTDPIHNFFVGLAYLSGIDMEVDRERAIKLITSAADAGLDQAMKKLALIYSKGDGVEKDMPKAVGWQKKLVDKLGDIAEGSRNEDEVMTYLREQMQLCEMAYSIEDYETAERSASVSFECAKVMAFGAMDKSVFGKARTLLKKFILNKSRYFNESMGFMFKACRIMLDVSLESGFWQSISEWSKKAITISGVANRIDNPSVFAEFFKISARMANECIKSGNQSAAEMWLDRAQELYQSLEDGDLTPETRYGFSFLYDSAIEHEIVEEDYSSAFDKYTKKKELLSALHDEFPDNFQIKCEIIKCWLTEARIAYLDGCFNNMGAAFIAKDLITDEIINSFGNPEFKMTEDMNTRDLLLDERGQYVPIELKFLVSKYYMLIGLSQYGLEKYDAAVSLLHEGAYEILEPLLEEYTNAEHRRDAVTIAETLGDCYYKTTDYTEAYEWHLKALNHAESVNASSRSVKESRVMAVLYEKLLEDSIKSENALKINEWNEKALWIRKGLVEGIEIPKMGIRRAKDVPSLVEQGKIASPQYLKDKAALEELEKKQGFIKSFSNKLMVSFKGTLKEYVSSTGSKENKADKRILSKQMRILTEDYKTTHPMVRFEIKQDMTTVQSEIWQNLTDLRNILFLTEQNDSVIMQATANQKIIDLAGKSADHIADYLLEHLVPFVKYDEQSMLLLSFCSYLFIHLAQIQGYDKKEELRHYLRFYKNIVFWHYPVEEIKYPYLWGMIYNWMRKESPFWIYVDGEEF